MKFIGCYRTSVGERRINSSSQQGLGSLGYQCWQNHQFSIPGDKFEIQINPVCKGTKKPCQLRSSVSMPSLAAYWSHKPGQSADISYNLIFKHKVQQSQIWLQGQGFFNTVRSMTMGLGWVPGKMKGQHHFPKTVSLEERWWRERRVTWSIKVVLCAPWVR